MEVLGKVGKFGVSEAEISGSCESYIRRALDCRIRRTRGLFVCEIKIYEMADIISDGRWYIS